MEIAFVSRSKFLEACEDAIRNARRELDEGGTVAINLDEGGYPGSILVTIRREERDFFQTDWEGNDKTRFPARIQAAVTALFNCGCSGQFRVMHTDGNLRISRE